MARNNSEQTIDLRTPNEINELKKLTRIMRTNQTSPEGFFPIDVALQLPIDTVTADTTLDNNYYTVLVTCSSVNITITLPQANTCDGRVYDIKKIDATAYTVIVDGYSAETIDGSATKTITARWMNIQIQSNGTSWFIL